MLFKKTHCIYTVVSPLMLMHLSLLSSVRDLGRWFILLYAAISFSIFFISPILVGRVFSALFDMSSSFIFVKLHNSLGNTFICKRKKIHWKIRENSVFSAALFSKGIPLYLYWNVLAFHTLQNHFPHVDFYFSKIYHITTYNI